MDTSDPEVEFDIFGVCNHCHSFDLNSKKLWFPTQEGEKSLNILVERVKEKNKRRKYDCILGLSGGLDSSYLALVLKDLGLRVLAVHVDGGWNSELAVSNIEKIVNYCDFDLQTHVVNWDTMRKLQLAFFKSGLANLDVPQDHVFFAVLHSLAVKNGCNIFMSGGNFATEFIFPRNWHGDAMDLINLKYVNNTYGDGDLTGYETINFWQWRILFKLRGFEQVRPLNFLPYGVKIARDKLESIGYRMYDKKHGESRFTKFFQNYFLIERFGFDKRLPHLSSRILSGDISRDDALRELHKPLYTPEDLNEDIAFISNKLEISDTELCSYIDIPKRYYDEMPNWHNNYTFLRSAYRFVTRYKSER